MNLNDCRLLVDLRKTQNITHTAANLYISQPALTYRIKQLEKKYQVPLSSGAQKGLNLQKKAGFYMNTH
ncbi:LysR family transcriptional regulator [Sporosarcina thermotolerans]|uniref:helix-turn-helix domain-containing protein n=1 Tax=Sporosarcina thermotolerans TaxID=633404 RepID=UPI0024BD4B17|nr:LysR family transcriptional regulator [Sporosarcina thermotolerans]WHT49651.1 LysR family transcriptional regulator [Sporosarcina thermotolerans]